MTKLAHSDIPTMLEGRNVRKMVDDAMSRITLGDGENTVTIDGVDYVITVAADDSHSVSDDGDWFGSIVYANSRYGRYRCERPDGFDGGARLISTYSGDTYWWQPPTDVISNRETLRGLQSTLLELIEYGYSTVRVGDDSLCGIGVTDDAGQINAAADMIEEAHTDHLIDRLAWASVLV